MFETIRVETDVRGVATLTLARAEKHNAMSERMIAELHEATEALAGDAGIRVVVLAADGASFCAGGDLGWMREQMDADAAARGNAARKLAHMLGALDRLPKPLIGRVQGNAFGGGLGLISVCDVAVAVEDARFGLTEVRLGLIPATIGPYVAARLGPAARRVFFTPRRFGAAEAVSLGLLARAVPAAELDAAVEEVVRPYLDAAPGAVASAKALIRRLGHEIDDGLIDETIAALVERWESEEAREGIAAFFDRRPAPWLKGGP
jgi:methylglutaconyl-CoA hydratase